MLAGAAAAPLYHRGEKPLESPVKGRCTRAIMELFSMMMSSSYLRLSLELIFGGVGRRAILKLPFCRAHLTAT